MAVKGSNIFVTQDTTLLAANNLAIEAATQAHNETHFVETKFSFMTSAHTLRPGFVAMRPQW